MTVSSTTRSVSFSCNGSTHEFDFPFKIFEEGDIRVFVRDSSGVETELTYTTNYEVSNAAGNYESGGTVTTVTYASGARATYAYASGNTLIIMRDLDRTQETDYVQNTKINMDTLENDFDRAVMLIQELDETLLRALVGPIEDGSPAMTLPTVAERAGCYLGFNDDGEPVAISGTVGTAAVSSFMAAVLLYETAEDLMAALGMSPGSDVQEHSAVRDRYRNLKIVNTNSTVTVTADEIVLQDASGVPEKVTAVNNSGDITAAGAGGLDTGAEATSTWYHIWMIAKADGTKAVLLSASATAPTLPAGYTFKAYLGAIYNTSGGHFITLKQQNNVAWIAPIADLSAGTQAVFTAVTLSIPTTAKEAILRLDMVETGGAGGFYYSRVDIADVSAGTIVGPWMATIGGGYTAYLPYVRVPITEAQTAYYKAYNGGGYTLGNVYIYTMGWVL